MKSIILASSSPLRQQLLARLQLSFTIAHPNVDETPLPDETAHDLVKRLALKKAQAIAPQAPNSLIIGCDEVGDVDGFILSKPGNHQNAVQQLQRCSGRNVIFYTGLCLYNSQTEQAQLSVETYSIQYRSLQQTTIENYLKRDQPYFCAGSIKAEQLGISLFQNMHGRDPTSLLGLPLIALCDMLANEDVDVVNA